MRWHSEKQNWRVWGVCGGCLVLDHSKEGRFPGSLLRQSGTSSCRDCYRNDKDEPWEEIKIPGDKQGGKSLVASTA